MLTYSTTQSLPQEGVRSPIFYLYGIVSLIPIAALACIGLILRL